MHGYLSMDTVCSFFTVEGQGGGNPGAQGVAEDGKQENKGREAGDLYEGGRREQKLRRQ